MPVVCSLRVSKDYTTKKQVQITKHVTRTINFLWYVNGYYFLYLFYIRAIIIFVSLS